MLILQRKKGEAVILSGGITITIQETGTDWVKLAIDAPKEVSILRAELAEAVKANQEAKASEETRMKFKQMMKGREN